MENIKKGELITTGKAKSLYESNESDFLIMHYRDDTSAFDGKKIESLEGKGTINNKFNAFIMKYLCLLYTSPSPRDGLLSRMPSSA